MAWNNTHKDKSVQLLESLSLSNLVFLSGGIQYADLRNSHIWKSVIVTMSLGMAAIQFFGIIGHQLFLRCIKEKRTKVDTTQTNPTHSVHHNYNDDHASMQGTEEETGDNNNIHLRESLIDDGTVEHCDNEYEPFITHPHIHNEHALHCLCCCK